MDHSLLHTGYLFNNITKIDIFRKVISFIINQCCPRRPKGASRGHKVPASREAQASEARLYIYLGHFKSTDHY